MRMRACNVKRPRVCSENMTSIIEVNSETFNVEAGGFNECHKSEHRTVAQSLSAIRCGQSECKK